MAATTRLAVKVVPSSSRDAVAGWLGEALKVRVSAAPERGRANDAVLRVIADALGVEKDRVRIATGAGSPRKLVEISDLSESEVYVRLSKPSP